MRKLNTDELSAACRIFRNVNLLAGQYYPRKTAQQIEGYVSMNRWIMFPDKGISSLKEGIEIPYPNVYTSFLDDEIVDNGKGQVDGYIGLTYHNTMAMEWLKLILKSKHKSKKFIDILKYFGQEWVISLSHKTKVGYKDTIPQYSEFYHTKPSEITAKELLKQINESDNYLLHYGDPYPDGGDKVLWDITVFTIGKETEVGTFNDDVIEVFRLFLKVLNLK